MAGSRAILFLPILVPVNLLIISRITGWRLRSLLPALPGPLLAAAAAIASERTLRMTGSWTAWRRSPRWCWSAAPRR